MATIRNRRKRAAYLVVFILAGIYTNAYAGSFADRFKDFVLNTDSEETFSDGSIVQLPETGSAKCMQCHDGSSARGVTLKHADAPMKFTQHGSTNHPVGMDYNHYASLNPMIYVPREQLDPRIILEDGEVTCLSCHALKSSPVENQGEFIKTSAVSNDEAADCLASKELTTGSSRNQLCFSCHAM